MPPDPTEVLRHLFGLSQDQLDTDIAIATEDSDKTWEERAANCTPRRGEDGTAADWALGCHHKFIMAHCLAQDPEIPDDEALYFATDPAVSASNQGREAAYADETGKVAELTRQQKLIEEREGLGPGDFWPPGDGPADYEALQVELCHELDRIQDDIVLRLLRRYRFDWIASLFEDDRMTYDVMWEVGRRYDRRFGKADIDIDSGIADEIANSFGQKGADLLRERLTAVGLTE